MLLHEIIIPAYHGTNSGWFRAFKTDRIGTGYDVNLGGVGILGRGFYFTPSKRKAADLGRRVVSVMLDLKNPLMIGKGSRWENIWTAAKEITGREVSSAEYQDVVRQAGYDGIIRRDYFYPELDEIVAFDPKQIKIIPQRKKPVNEARKRLKVAAERIGVATLMAWGKTIGVYAEVSEKPTYIDLAEVERDESAPKGCGAVFMRALCAYADARRKPIYLATVGWDDALPKYYRRFGFSDKQRDEESGDLVMVREPR